jgi:hypothetical protein
MSSPAGAGGKLAAADTDILRTDGEAHAGLFASIGDGGFADEVAIASTREP